MPDDIAPAAANSITDALDDILKKGDVTAEQVLAHLESAGFTIQGSDSEAPVEGDGMDETNPNRPERNPPVGAGNDGNQALGEPMSMEDIAGDLYNKHFKGNQ